MPTKPKTIAIRVSGTDVVEGQLVYVFNQGTGDTWTGYLESTDDGLVTLVNLRNPNAEGEDSTAWASGNIIECTVVGTAYGRGTVTLGAQQDQEVTITTTADSSGPAISI